MESTELSNERTEAARLRWLEASQHATQLALEMYQPGGGYGDPQAEAADKHKLETARADADRLMREYHDLDRQFLEQKMLALQKSQGLATWASFAVAAVVGLTTIISTLITLYK